MSKQELTNTIDAIWSAIRANMHGCKQRQAMLPRVFFASPVDRPAVIQQDFADSIF